MSTNQRAAELGLSHLIHIGPRVMQGAGARSGAVSKVYRESLSKKNIHTRYGFQITYNPAVYTQSSSLEGVREADERRLVHVHVGDELGLELRLA